MLSCREVSELVSQSLERKLPLRQRLSMQLHLSMCRLCSGFRRQLLLLRQAASLEARRAERDPPPDDAPHLSDDARRRIQEALDRAAS